MTRTLHYHLAYLDNDFQGWSDFVATNFLLDTALTTFFEAAQNSTYEPLRARSRKIVQEERIHAMHAEGWVKRLAKAGGAVRAALVSALAATVGRNALLVRPGRRSRHAAALPEGIIDATPDELRSRYLQKIMPTLSGLDIDVAAAFNAETKRWEPSQPLPWEHWKAVSRRLEN